MWRAMPPDLAIPATKAAVEGWRAAGFRFALAWLALFALTIADWRAMAHQWWDIDTYSHILLIPPIIAWLVWIRRDELAKNAPQGWWPGLGWMALGLALWFAGRTVEINTIAQGGTVIAFQGAALAILGLRTGLLLLFPLAYAFLLVPMGGELIPALQLVTAEIAIALTHWSGVEATIDGINIDTPAGLFIVAEACSGVKFLIAMLALGVLVAWTCFSSWKRRAWLLIACVIVPILANGVRAWATIFIAQYVGAEAAGSFDHVVYGWVFFGVVIAMILGAAWRWFEREPEDAGWTATEIDRLPAIRLERFGVPANIALATVLFAAIAFAALARVL